MTWFLLGRLTVIDGLEGLTELQELYLSHNVIETAQGLDSQVKLTSIADFLYNAFECSATLSE